MAGGGRISIAMLCRIVDIDPRTYDDWRRRHLISRFSETKSLGDKEAAELANLAGGRVVLKFGTAGISPTELLEVIASNSQR